MKLRTRLFFSFSALMTVALLGLVFALISVMLISSSRTQLTQHHFQIVETTQQLRANMGNQLLALLEPNVDRHALQRADAEFEAILQEALLQEKGPAREAFAEVLHRYYQFRAVTLEQLPTRAALRPDSALSEAYVRVRSRLADLQQSSLDTLRNESSRGHEHALLIASLLGLVGLGVVLIGYVTASGLARRFSQPIESLADAADRISHGDFNIIMPLTSIKEMSSLSRRFGLMAESLRQFKTSDVEALTSGQRRLQAVLDSIDDGLLILDREGRLEHLNPVALRQLGWAENSLGQRLGHALQRPELDTQLQRVLEGGYLEQAPEDLVIEAQGETRLLTYSLTPVSHSQGHIMGAVMVLRDVTEQRAFDRLRSEFVLRASHELRTPVTGMHMAFSLLCERLKFGPETRERDLVKTVEDEMKRLLLLINDLLNFSRYQNGMQKLNLEQCDLNDLLAYSYQRFAGVALEQGVEMEYDVQPSLPNLRLDCLLIGRVLDNLVDNALRHSVEGGRIRLQARRHGERVILSVEDNGEGIAFGQQSRIFEPFVQVGRKKGGVGLGLALCKEIVQLHGGRIGVYSRPGMGTQFYFALPI
jgi:NtrC-family two-component system sensor histidine kinase KinB